ncbi:hypothetical protein ACIL7C_24310, partial [Escherichia coli]
FRQSCNSILRCPSISDGRLSYQFSSDGYIRRSVYAYPKTHEVVGYRYFGLDDPAYLVWFGEIGVHEFAYLVKNYVAAVN